MLRASTARLSALLSRPTADYTLAAERLEALFAKSEAGRPEFLAHLQSIGVDKLADRQLFANALGRAKRKGMFEQRDGTVKEM